MNGKENGISAEHTSDAAQSDPLLCSSSTQPSADSGSEVQARKAEHLPRSSEVGQTKSQQSPPTDENLEMRDIAGDSLICTSDHD